MTFNVTVERFDDPRYSRPRYRLRYPMRVDYLRDGYTCCSYKFKRDAQRRADELNAAYARADRA
jgi:hypothetical protein